MHQIAPVHRIQPLNRFIQTARAQAIAIIGPGWANGLSTYQPCTATDVLTCLDGWRFMVIQPLFMDLSGDLSELFCQGAGKRQQCIACRNILNYGAYAQLAFATFMRP